MKRLGLLLAVSALAACRNADDDGNSLILNLVPSPFGANGCVGPDQVFSPPQTPSEVALAVLDIEPGWSQVTAAADAEVLYATGAGATVVEIDVSSSPPVEFELVGAGVVDALLAAVGIAGPARLSGIAVIDPTTLLVMEHVSNTLLAVDRVQGTVVFFAGEPNPGGGFADGAPLPPQSGPPMGPVARFHFTEPSQLLATDPTLPFVFIADAGNHAIRILDASGVQTFTGRGAPFFADGDLRVAGFDTPVGLTLTCAGAVLVSETGAVGAGGHRIRELSAQFTPFGIDGQALTLVGDGTDATRGGAAMDVRTAAPVSPFATADGEVYWIDSTTGVLRRMRADQSSVNCPLWNSCSDALARGGTFTPGGVHSLTQTPGGVLYVLDSDAQMLLRVTP